jgi:hypothetical protein
MILFHLWLRMIEADSRACFLFPGERDHPGVADVALADEY